MLQTARPASVSVATLVAVGATLLASSARADVASSNVCDASLDCTSKGNATLKAESREPIISSIGTGWLPACATPDAQGHCSDENIQVSTSIDLAAFPEPSREPLWMVDMTKAAVVAAAWPTPAAFELTVPTAPTMDGIFKVSHTLIPAVRVYANILGFKREWMYDASRFVTENAANFDYKATNTVMFAPWAMTQGVVNKVPAPTLTNTALLNVDLVKNSDNEVQLGLSASTSPTFTFRTTKVSLAGATAITKDAVTGKLPMVDADFLDLKADVEGEITVDGELIAAPYVAIKKIAGFTIPGGPMVLDLTNPLNAPKRQYTSEPPVAMKFPSVTVRIPLPNVKVPKSLDLDAAQVGQRSEKAVTIPNTGELGAKLKAESSDPQFTVDVAPAIGPKAEGTMTVRFSPAKDGEQTATITVRSSDPDSPVQTMTVKATGTKVPVVAPAPEDTGPPPAAGEIADSGCGCKTAGSSSGAPASAALAGFAAVLGLVVRRRRAR